MDTKLLTMLSSHFKYLMDNGYQMMTGYLSWKKNSCQLETLFSLQYFLQSVTNGKRDINTYITLNGSNNSVAILELN